MAQGEEKPEKSRGGGSSKVGGLLVNAIGIFALTLGAVVAGGFVNERLHPRQQFAVDADGKLVLKNPVPEAEEPAEQKPAVYFAFEPPLIVNFDDPDAVRFLQLQIEVLARDPAVIESVKLHSPVIRNNLLMLINGRDHQTLMTREGKDALRKEALAEVQKILKKETGQPGIEDLFFTSFVMQ
ncbi:MAG: flagellar basal body-associated FliL family protein [Steroidobacteraceae bacterium]|jgi:flagellar FliL protein|nr:flagellar basal body-associated FliL family protein [Steroidobacteraceae bacterium]